MSLGRLGPGDHVGPYRIVRLLGEGGMGAVFLATDERLGRDIALKLLPGEISGDRVARERLVREARAASRISHPNVVGIHDVGEVDGDVYLVLEYVDGEPLSKVMASGPLPIPDIVRIGIQIASALDAAHARGVVHRDIKPANVLVRSDGVAKVVDFGLAMRVPGPLAESEATDGVEDSSRLTRTGYAVGTVSYMSPEQVAGETPDGRSDLFSLGIVLYEAATGKLPFLKSSVLATAAAIMHDPPEPLRAVLPDAPSGFVEVVERCLEKDPRKRPQTGAAVAEALRLLEAGHSTRFVRHALGPRAMPRWAVAGAIAFAAVAVLSVTAYLALREIPPVEPVRIVSDEARRLLAQSETYAARGTNRANLTNATDLARRALAAEPANTFLQAHLANMLGRLQADDLDPAHSDEIESLAAKALATDPTLAEAWFGRSWSLLSRRSYDGALEAAVRGRTLAPKEWTGYVLAGRALIRLGRVDEGLAELRRGIDTEGGHIFARAVLGYELLQLGRRDEAAVEFLKVLEYQPDHPSVLNNLGAHYLYTGRYLECIPLFQKLLATQPDAAAASNLGTAYFYLDRNAEAIRAYERAIEMDPKNPEHKRNLGDAQDRAGVRDEARRSYEGALEDCERLVRAGTADDGTRRLRALMLCRLGRTAEALREADSFVRESPKDMLAVYAAAQIQAMAGTRERTFALVGRAIELGYPREEFRRDPYFGTLRVDREFLDLLVK